MNKTLFIVPLTCRSVEPFLVQQLHVMDLPLTIGWTNHKHGAVLVFSLVEMSPVADRAGYIPRARGNKTSVIFR